MDSFELENKLSLLVEASGFRLIAAHWKVARGRHLLRVIADAEDHNITVDECATLSRLICDLLDAYPHDFPDYRLEVSSPGLNHALEKWQLNKNLGRFVEVRYLEGEVEKVLRGDLIAARETEIQVQGEAQIRGFGFEQIKQIFVLPKIGKR